MSMNKDPVFRDDLLAGHRILVTGGGTGLGREIASKYLSLGATVWICGRRGGLLDETSAALTAEHGGTVRTHAVDLRSAEAVEAMVDAIWADGPLTGLVNNAAGNFISPTEQISPRGFDAIAGVVLHGTFYVTNAIGRRWIRDGLPGSIVSILTTWVRTGSPFTVPSAMAKSGVDAMTKSLAIEWGRHGIRANAIAPGVFPTEGMTARLDPGEDGAMRGAANPMGRVGRMEELQNLATFLMAPGCEWLTGETIAIDGAGHHAYGAQFTRLFSLSGDDWAERRRLIKQTNERDKAARSV
jgi:NAD(P)-dependent dehydrogenase (short-subunit alcohol dehydrogenase family)